MKRHGNGHFQQRLAVVALALLLAIEPALAAVPGFINYQARLTNASGAPLEGSQTLTFRFYATSSDQTPLAVQTITANANKGLVSVQIPASAPVFTEAERWLEVSIGDETLAPRTRLAAVPYALQAGMAADVADGAVGASKLAAGAVGEQQLANAAVTSVKLAPSGVTAGTYGGIDSTIQFTVGSDGRITSVSNIPLHSGNDSFTKLLIHANGTDGSAFFADSSSNGHTITTNGNVQIDTAQKKFGEASGLFDGVSGYLSIPDSDDWNFGSGDFTIDLWAMFQVSNAVHYLYLQYDSTSGNYIRLFLVDNKLQFGATVGGVAVASYETTDTGLITNGIWHHLALVRSGSSIRIFVNGVSRNLTEYTPINANNLGDLPAQIQIGRWQDGSRYFNGWIDEYRVSKGMARWTADFTPPGSEYK